MSPTNTSVYKNSTIHQLIEEWEQLENNHEIEHKKLSIIEQFEALLKIDVPAHYFSNNKIQKYDYFLSQNARQALYYFLLTFGLLEDCAGSYLFGSTLFSLIPGLSAPILALASLMFVGLSSIFFLSFQGTFLKDALDIPYTSSDESIRLALYTQHLQTTIVINKLLATIYMMQVNSILYDDYIKLATLLNDNIALKDKTLSTYPKSLVKDVCEKGLLAFGALSSIAGSYFMANIIISLLAPVLIGTPIGCAIIAVITLASLIINFAMGMSSIVRLVHPNFEMHHALKKDLALFQTTYPEELKRSTLIKGRFFERTLTADPCRQRDVIEHTPLAVPA